MNEYTEFFANALAHSVLLVLSMVYLANGYKIPVCIYVYGFLYNMVPNMNDLCPKFLPYRAVILR